MMKIIAHMLIIIAAFTSCNKQSENLNYDSEILKIVKIRANTFIHTSYLKTKNFGKVPCNGMVVIDNGEALIIDTPTGDSSSKELIYWILNTLKSKPIGVVATHFHEDCLGGMNEFHKMKIPSYGTFKTIYSAKKDSLLVPQNGFENYLEIQLGSSKVINEFIGEGHTSDNIISYFPKDKVLFGGCLIKKIGANKGYLGDANVNAWSKTVSDVKAKYSEAKTIIPGHGNFGGDELLDYTIELFNPKNLGVD